MSDDRTPRSLDDLDARLREARERASGATPEESSEESGGDLGRALGLAFRVGAELVAALVVGVGAGYLLDRWLGTRPWGLIVMFFLGAAAGMLNVYRAVSGLGYAPGYRRREDERPRPPQQ